MMEYQVKDREDHLFGKETETVLFNFEQPAHFSSLCGLCVDGEDVRVFGSPTEQCSSPREAVCVANIRVSFRNEQWLSHLTEYLSFAAAKFDIPASSHGGPKLRVAIFQRAGEAVSLPLPERDAFLRLFVQLPSKCTGGALNARAGEENHLLQFDSNYFMFHCGLALVFTGLPPIQVSSLLTAPCGFQIELV